MAINTLDAIAKDGLLNGTFEEDEDDISAVVEEFYPAADAQANHQTVTVLPLAEKLERRARTQTKPA